MAADTREDEATMDNPAIIQELNRLYELKKSGQITEKELQQKRTEVLASSQPTEPPPPPFYRRKGFIIGTIVVLLLAGLGIGLGIGLSNNNKTAASGGSNGGGSNGGGTSGGGNGVNAVVAKLNANGATAYIATYTAAGGPSSVAGATIQFAEAPGAKFAFVANTAHGKSDFFSNGRVTYLCAGRAGSPWTCFSLSAANVGSYRAVSDFFSGRFWATQLHSYAAAAGAHRGVIVTTSTRTIGGARVDCVSAHGGPAASGGTVCVNGTGVLAYAKDNRTGETITLTHWGAPPASTFVLPAGAKVTAGLPAGVP
jgi:hypothetical protein